MLLSFGFYRVPVHSGLEAIGEHSSIFPAPILFSLPSLSQTYQKDGSYCVFGFVNVVPGCKRPILVCERLFMAIFVIFCWYYTTFWAYSLWVELEYRRVLDWMIGYDGMLRGMWMWWWRIKERIIGVGGEKITFISKFFVGRCNIIIVWASIVGSIQLTWYCWGFQSDWVK